MKKLTTLFYALTSMTLISCVHYHNGNINISYNESGHFYSMKAHFNKSKTRDVEKYMDDCIGKRSSMSFVNTRIDGQIALEDHTTFYIRKYPGLIEIKLDKNENSDEAYQRIKLMCEGMKEVIVR